MSKQFDSVANFAQTIFIHFVYFSNLVLNANYLMQTENRKRWKKAKEKLQKEKKGIPTWQINSCT